MAEQPAPVTFTWSLPDAKALTIARADARGSRFRRLALFILGFALIAAAALSAAERLLGPMRLDRLVTIALSIGVVLALLFHPLYWTFIFPRLYRRSPLAGHAVTIGFDGEGVSVSGAGFASRLVWGNVGRLVLAPEHLVLLYRGGETGIAIPRRAAPSRDAFAALARHAAAHVPADALGPGFAR